MIATFCKQIIFFQLDSDGAKIKELILTLKIAADVIRSQQLIRYHSYRWHNRQAVQYSCEVVQFLLVQLH